MNHKEILLEIYKQSFLVTDIRNVNQKTRERIKSIGGKINSQKGVFTVLTTLLTHKILDIKQDIRKHQASMAGGFSGRGIDSHFITPTLKELGLPSMAESGWLTRSLEQPYPYDLNYNGKISDKVVKEAFLNIVDFVEKYPQTAKNILRLLLFEAIQSKNNAVVPITPLKNPEILTINNIVKAFAEHFSTNYKTHGGAKLPVLAFFAIYQCLISEIARYKDCTLGELGSHTASDRTSKSAGDIQIFKGEYLFEAVEIKLNKPIDLLMLRIAFEKIARYNPDRYYILSNSGTIKSESVEIENLITEIKQVHGCQIVINGILPTIKYYLRLLESLGEFVSHYSNLVEKDDEIQKIHKEKWNELLLKYLQ